MWPAVAVTQNLPACINPACVRTASLSRHSMGQARWHMSTWHDSRAAITSAHSTGIPCAQQAAPAKMLLSLCALLGDSPQRPTTAFSLDSELQPARRVPSEQHAIPERLLTNKQAAALLSGIPAHLRVARAQHRESFLHLAEPGPEGEPGMHS